MLVPGPAKKVTVYVDENVRHRGEPLYVTVLNHLFRHEVSGATVTKGVAGFGAHHQIHTSRILEASERLPIKIEFIEAPGKVEALMPDLLGIVVDGLVEVQDTTIVKAAAAGRPTDR